MPSHEDHFETIDSDRKPRMTRIVRNSKPVRSTQYLVLWLYSAFRALRSALFLVFLGGVLSLTAGAADRPNILWLIAEDFGPDLGCYGTKEVSTPNLDRLAEQGVRYTRFFTTAPVCSASRSRVHDRHVPDDHRRAQPSLAPRRRLSAARGRPRADRLVARRRLFHRQRRASCPPHFGFTGTGKTDWNFTYDGKPFDSDRWGDLKTHQPFFAQINFQETHRTFHAPKHADPAKVVIPPYYPDHPVTREDWAKYLDAATELDRKVGLILKQLEADGLADNTIVVFIGDHGQAHVRGKQFCYDERPARPADHPLAEEFPGAAAGYGRARSMTACSMAIDLAPDDARHRRRARSPRRCRARSSSATTPPPRASTSSAPATAATRPSSASAPSATDRYRYIRNFTPERPFLQANDYKERSYPVWNLLKELDAEGKLTPLQKFLTAPTMPPEEALRRTGRSLRNGQSRQLTRASKVLVELRTAVDRWIEDSNDQGQQLEPAGSPPPKAPPKPAATPTPARHKRENRRQRNKKQQPK